MLVILAFNVLGWGQNFFPTELDLDSFYQSYRNVDIDNLDVSGLLRDAGRKYPELTEEDAAQLITRNVSYIIFHLLNRDRLFRAPDGQYVVDRATEIYDSLDHIEHLISQGRDLPPGEFSEMDREELLSEMKSTARKLRKQFRRYFVELSEAEYEVRISQGGDSGEVMSLYLDECAKVNNHLKSTLDRFFFNPSPGVVTVEDYGNYSVALLSRSLEVLADSFADSLDRRVN